MTLLLTGPTDLLRLWFGLASIGFSFWILSDRNYPIEHAMTLAIASTEAQMVLFFIHGAAMLYGVTTGTYNRLLLILEGVLGIFLWVGIGASEAVHQGSPGPMLIAGGGIALFLLVRYPTHYTGSR